MADRNKGFDPLASLFEAPEPGLAPAEDAPAPEAVAPPEAGAALPLADGLDKAAIARSVALAAAARLADQKAAEPAPAPAPPAPASTPTVDKEAVARAVAQAATARLAGQKKAKAAATPEAPQPAPAPARAPKSRLDRLASRAVRPRGALDAARAAAKAEATHREEAAVARATARKQKLSDRVQEMISGQLPGLGRFQVERSIFADQRPVLSALWKGHRAKFLADGALERAVSAAAVLHALAHVPHGRLVAAHVETDASDYLVWIDLDIATGDGTLLAAFADARAYFAAG